MQKKSLSVLYKNVLGRRSQRPRRRRARRSEALCRTQNDGARDVIFLSTPSDRHAFNVGYKDFRSSQHLVECSNVIFVSTLAAA
mmetsp:Transcript_454/g.1382  ORF Transcript_454/g.1382 Transcript_454/m.1382 type:complete len:84 (-) Transcript_454:14-265(-)